MTKIIWVTGGLMTTDKLAETLREVKSRECLIVKVETVQEAICEMYESAEPASLVICDSMLSMSIPRRELRSATEFKHVPYLIAMNDDGEEKLASVGPVDVPKDGPLVKLFKKLKVVPAADADMATQLGCSLA